MGVTVHASYLTYLCNAIEALLKTEGCPKLEEVFTSSCAFSNFKSSLLRGLINELGELVESVENKSAKYLPDD
jgi:hypothetical protein